MLHVASVTVIICYTDAALTLQRTLKGPKLAFSLSDRDGARPWVRAPLACGSLPGPGSLPPSLPPRLSPAQETEASARSLPAASPGPSPTSRAPRDQTLPWSHDPPSRAPWQRRGRATPSRPPACLLATSRREPGLDSGAPGGPACPAAATARLRALVS